MTPQAWGNEVRAADPGYSGPRPRVQLWHGTADTTLNYVELRRGDQAVDERARREPDALLDRHPRLRLDPYPV